MCDEAHCICPFYSHRHYQGCTLRVDNVQSRGEKIIVIMSKRTPRLRNGKSHSGSTPRFNPYISIYVACPLRKQDCTVSIHTHHDCGNVIMGTTSPDQGSQEYEEQHVHNVYEQVASHFSSTRYKVSLWLIHVRRCYRLTELQALANCPAIPPRAFSRIRWPRRWLRKREILECQPERLHCRL